MPEPEDRASAITRRELVVNTAFIPLVALTASAQQRGGTKAGALSSGDLRTLEAFIDRLIPADELGPGAVEAGVSTYIDRALAESHSNRKASFTEGLRSIDGYARSLHGQAFTELSAADQEVIIARMESGGAEGFDTSRSVFTSIRSLALEGMFGDPYYGGNRNYAGWDLLRYPGPRLAVAPEDQGLSPSSKPYRKSAWGTEHGR
jgi:hypothetical protein